MISDFDIRNQIVIPCNKSSSLKNGYSNIQLAIKYSNNEHNFNIFKKLLSETDTYDMHDLLISTICDFGSTSNINVVKLLIESGANINYKTRGDWTPIICACFYPEDNSEIIKLLIESGADINSKSKTGAIALAYLIEYSSVNADLDIIKLLIRKGSLINNRDVNGHTPLMSCFQNNNIKLIRYDIIKLLLDNKADIYIRNNHSGNILGVVRDKIGEKSDIYSLIFYYKNISNDVFCEYDINFIYEYQYKN